MRSSFDLESDQNGGQLGGVSQGDAVLNWQFTNRGPLVTGINAHRHEEESSSACVPAWNGEAVGRC